MVNNIANDGYFGNLTVKKFFETDGSYSTWELRRVFIEDLPGILMVMSHGTYTALWRADFGSPFIGAYEELVSTDFLQNLNSTNITIMVTIACQSAAFDIGEYNGDNSLSFAEAAIISKGGVVAYLGNTRISFGSYTFYLEDGRLMFLTQPYAQGVVYNFFEAYAGGAYTVGEIFARALDNYYSTFGIWYSYHKRAILEAIMLGDPATSLPRITKDTSGVPIVESADSWEHEGKELYKVEGPAVKTDGSGISYVFVNGSSILRVTLVSPYYQSMRDLPEVSETVDPPALIAVKPSMGGVNILKVCDSEGQESRYYIFVPMVHLLGFEASFLDIDNNRKYEAINVSLKVEYKTLWCYLFLYGYELLTRGFYGRIIVMPDDPNATFADAYIDYDILFMGDITLGVESKSYIIPANGLLSISNKTRLVIRLRIYPYWPDIGGWFVSGDYIDVAIDEAIVTRDMYSADDFEQGFKLVDSRMEMLDFNKNGKYDAIRIYMSINNKLTMNLSANLVLSAEGETVRHFIYRTITVEPGTQTFTVIFPTCFLDYINSTKVRIEAYLCVASFSIYLVNQSYSIEIFDRNHEVSLVGAQLYYKTTQHPLGARVYLRMNATTDFRARIETTVVYLCENGTEQGRQTLDPLYTPMLFPGENTIDLLYIPAEFLGFSKYRVEVTIYHYDEDTGQTYYLTNLTLNISLDLIPKIPEINITPKLIDIDSDGKYDHILMDIDSNLSFFAKIGFTIWMWHLNQSLSNSWGSGWGEYYQDISMHNGSEILLPLDSRVLLNILGSTPTEEYPYIRYELKLRIYLRTCSERSIPIWNKSLQIFLLSENNFSRLFDAFEPGGMLTLFKNLSISPTVMMVIEGITDVKTFSREINSDIYVSRYVPIAKTTNITHILIELDGVLRQMINVSGNMTYILKRSEELNVGVHTYGIHTYCAEKTSTAKIQLMVAEKNPPVISNVSYYPMVPYANETISITAIIIDDFEVSEAILYYKLDGQEAIAIYMRPQSNTTWYAQLPPTNKQATIAFWIVAYDFWGNNASSRNYTVAVNLPDNQPPKILLVSWKPTKPKTGESVVVSVVVTDDVGVEEVILAITKPREVNISMAPAGNQLVWEAEFIINGTIEFIIIAKDYSQKIVVTEVFTITVESISIAYLAILPLLAVVAVLIYLYLKARRKYETINN